jgi:hypothetical protein
MSNPFQGSAVWQWSSSSASASNVTDSNLVRVVAVAVSTTAVQPILSGLRIRWLEVWCPVGATQADVTSVKITWDGVSAAGESFNTKYGQSMSTKPGYFVSKPAKGTSPYNWISSPTGTNYFTISYPKGVVIRMHFHYMITPEVTGLAQVTSLSGLVTGNTYYGRLDGVGGNLLPLGVNYG